MSKPLPSLKAMAENKVEGVSKQTTFVVDARLVEFEEGFNGRPIDPEHVASFKETKRNGGTWPAITVRVEDGRIIAVDGHHRVTAQLEMLADDKDGVVTPGLDAVQFRGNDADRVLLMITSQQGKPMTPLQLGVQYRKMIAFGWKPAAIAARVGKSSQHVNDMIKLAEANSDVQGMVERGEVAAHVALKTVKKHGSGAGKVLAGHLDEAKTAGKTKVTNKTVQKGLDAKTLANAGKGYVQAVASKSEIAKEHLRAMSQSPSVDKSIKDAIKTVINGAFGKLSASGPSLVEAIEQEIESKGEIMAETLCPDFAHLIVYLRASGVK
jgi:ParB-like chromosome segregation protein Spo0J